MFGVFHAHYGKRDPYHSFDNVLDEMIAFLILVLFAAVLSFPLMFVVMHLS